MNFPISLKFSLEIVKLTKKSYPTFVNRSEAKSKFNINNIKKINFALNNKNLTVRSASLSGKKDLRILYQMLRHLKSRKES